MGSPYADKRRRRNPRGNVWAWSLFLVGVFVFGWGCTTQSSQQRKDRQGDDRVGLDQYDRYMGDGRTRRQDPQRRQASGWNTQQGSWMDGSDPMNGHQKPPIQRPTPAGSPTAQCLQLQESLAQQQCLLPLLSQGNQTSKQHLKALLRQGYHGTKAVFTLLQQGDVSLRTFLMRSILQDSVYVRTHSISLIAALYKIAKQDFLEALSVLPAEQKMQVASRLVLGLRFVTRKRVTREFGAYLQIPAGPLWTRIQQETALPTSMALVSLSDCVTGRHSAAPTYTQAMQSLQNYYVTWRVWSYAAKASGMRQYLQAMRAFRRGQTRYRPRPRINKSALRLAIILARRLQQLKPNTEKAILGVGPVIPRERMKSWFSQLLAKSPNLANKPSGAPQARPVPRKDGKIEL